MHHIYQIIQQAKVELCNEQQLHALVFSQVPYLPILSSLSNKKEHLHHTVIMELENTTVYRLLHYGFTINIGGKNQNTHKTC